MMPTDASFVAVHVILLSLVVGSAARYAFADWLIHGRRDWPGVGTVLHEFAERGGSRGNYSLQSVRTSDSSE